MGRATRWSRRAFGPPLVLMILAALVAVPASGCAQSSGEASPPSATDGEVAGQDALNTLTEAERAEGWRLLFDGTSLDQWKGYQTETVPESWAAVDGMLARVGGGGDLMTRSQFGSFELSLEWRVEEGGNSGILYLVTEAPNRMWEAAPEYQVLDDAAHRDGQSPLTSAGAAYALYPAPRGVVKPAGEWNASRIVVDGTRVEHWLNGQKLLEYDLDSEDFRQRVADSKFSEWPIFGQARRGHIGLQDHGNPVWYRNLKIREIG